MFGVGHLTMGTVSVLSNFQQIWYLPVVLVEVSVVDSVVDAAQTKS